MTHQIKTELFQKILELKETVDSATYNIKNSSDIEEHGTNTKQNIIQRLQSYSSGIEKSFNYLNSFDELIAGNKMHDLDLTASKIKAISELIKSDARDLLCILLTGKENYPEETIWN